MSTVQSSAKTQTQWKPNDAWLIGIVLAVINFWLFAQTLLARQSGAPLRNSLDVPFSKTLSH